jgi:predicted dehydrogenase
MYVDELRSFVDDVRAGARPSAQQAEQGAAVLAIALAALRSAAQGRTIDLHAEDPATGVWLSSFRSPA